MSTPHGLKEKQDGKVRRRKFGSKTKTGCQTCRIRKVKCDETKPFCNRCTTTGRKCDGYPSKTAPVARKYTPPIVWVPTRTTGSTPEKRGFQFFLINTVPELAGYFTSSFWEHFVLQASTAEPSLRHAIIAIGALHEEFRSRRLMSTSYGEKTSTRIGEDMGTAFAIDQYTKALSHLRRSLSSGKQAPLTALMSCALFVCFDSLRGNFESAFLHLKSGIRVLRDIRMGKLQAEDHYIIQKNVLPLFERLSIQAHLYIDTRETEDRIRFSREWGGIQSIKGVEEKEFRSLEDARDSLYRATGGLVRALFACHGDLSMGLQSIEVLRLFKTYSTLLHQWDQKFSTFMAQNSATLSLRQIRGAALLKIHHTTAQIMSLIAPISPENPDHMQTSIIVSMNAPSAFIPHTQKMIDILNLSRSLLTATDQDSKNREPSLTFSSDLGVVGPLYYVCTKCTVLEVRREAMELLRTCKRREGMWDSDTETKIVGEFWELEEQHNALETEAGVGREGVTMRERVRLVLESEAGWRWIMCDNEGEEAISDGNGGDTWWGLLNGQGGPREGEILPVGGGDEIGRWSEDSLWIDHLANMDRSVFLDTLSGDDPVGTPVNFLHE